MRWTKILGDETSTIQTVLFDRHVAGSVLSYVDEDGRIEVSYWIGKPYWSKGIATRALSEFLKHIKVRPLYARAAKDNSASLRVLEKCGFTRIGEGQGFSNKKRELLDEYYHVHVNVTEEQGKDEWIAMKFVPHTTIRQLSCIKRIQNRLLFLLFKTIDLFLPFR